MIVATDYLSFHFGDAIEALVAVLYMATNFVTMLVNICVLDYTPLWGKMLLGFVGNELRHRRTKIFSTNHYRSPHHIATNFWQPKRKSKCP